MEIHNTEGQIKDDEIPNVRSGRHNYHYMKDVIVNSLFIKCR